MGLTFSAPFGSAGNHEAGKRSQKTNAVGFHSYEVPRGVKLERQTVKLWFPGAGERGGPGGLFFSGCRAPALQDENILEVAGDDGWVTECRY